MENKTPCPVNEKVSIWERKFEEHRQKQLINPFSEWEGASHRQKLSTSDKNYGKPIEGSMTELRGKNANEHVSSEIVTLLQTIKQNGTFDKNVNLVRITFGCLFGIYTRISNKVVGILLRARKYGFVNFDGEMLFQGRDENVLISLTKTGQDILQPKRIKVA